LLEARLEQYIFKEINRQAREAQQVSISFFFFLFFFFVLENEK